MKNAIRFIFIYVLFSQCAVFLFQGLLKSHLVPVKAETLYAGVTLIPMLLMVAYLYYKGYVISAVKTFFKLKRTALLWSLLMGFSSILFLSLMREQISLPDWKKQTFDILQSGWIGIIGIVCMAPILEELLFRKAITDGLLKEYSKQTAILLSGILFGVVHFNPAQTIPAVLIGILFAWIYCETRSLLPTLVLHIGNNILAVWVNTHYTEYQYTWQIVGWNTYYLLVGISFIVMLIAMYQFYQQNRIG